MTLNNYEKFVALHQKKEAMVLYNCWNVATAKSVEKMKGDAIATSSYAIADSLGYEDGEQLKFFTLREMIANIAKNTSLPLTVDVETGYGDDIEMVLENVLSLVRLGVVGINLEDQVIGAKTYHLETIEKQSHKIKKIMNDIQGKGYPLFINARTDVFFMEENHSTDTVDLALERCEAYQKAGAQCIFVPGLTDMKLIEAFVSKACLPVNIMISNDDVAIEQFNEIGVKRISYGSTSYFKANQDFEERLKRLSIKK